MRFASEVGGEVGTADGKRLGFGFDRSGSRFARHGRVERGPYAWWFVEVASHRYTAVEAKRVRAVGAWGRCSTEG